MGIESLWQIQGIRGLRANIIQVTVANSNQGRKKGYWKQQIVSHLFQQALLRLESDAASSTRLPSSDTQFHSLGTDCLVLSFPTAFDRQIQTLYSLH
jgi:hypothetical protein